MMKYLTTKGKIISGETPVEIFESWKQSSPLDDKLTFGNYIEILALRVHVYHNKRVALQWGLAQLLDELEEMGIILRVE